MMKFLSIVAAASLALTPAIASAGSDGDNTDSTVYSRPIAGPVAVDPADEKIVVFPIAIGAGAAGLALLILLLDGDSNDSTDATVDTIGTTNGTN